MVEFKKVMFECMVYIMGGHLWLYYCKFDKNVEIMLHAHVLAAS